MNEGFDWDRWLVQERVKQIVFEAMIKANCFEEEEAER